MKLPKFISKWFAGGKKRKAITSADLTEDFLDWESPEILTQHQIARRNTRYVKESREEMIARYGRLKDKQGMSPFKEDTGRTRISEFLASRKG